MKWFLVCALLGVVLPVAGRAAGGMQDYPFVPVPFTQVQVRIPGWARGEPLPSELYRYIGETEAFRGLTLNGEAVDATIGPDGYVAIQRTWRVGDVLELAFPMPIRRVLCHDNVEANRGRVAIERGPVVYCIEGADHDGRVMQMFLPDDAALTATHRPDLLGGVTILTGTARGVFRNDAGDIEQRPVPMTMIPYYAWCHRGANEMQVWIPRTAEHAQPPPVPTLAASHGDSGHDPGWIVTRTGNGRASSPSEPRGRKGGILVAETDQPLFPAPARSENSPYLAEARLQPGFSGGILEWSAP